MVHVKLAPSLLTADFARLGEEIRAAEEGGADLLHLDVMDGHFVPNISFGHVVIESLRKVTDLPFDIHLMVADPDLQIEHYVELAETLNVHVETTRHINRTLWQIRRLGARCGVCLNPGTPIAAIEESLGEVDQVMVMAINPGWGGQQMMPSQLDKVRRIRGLLEARGSAADVMLDGGVKVANAAACVAAGANILVCGSSVFNPDATPQASLAALRAAIAG
jgi:ribulose-phosphate 3-epimerase